MKRIKLSDRLAAAAGLVAPGARVIDVGTDHGRIPVYLAQTARADAIFASDVNAKPLARARELARLCGVDDKITFLLGDGLGVVGRGDVDTVIISGMGGETAERILSGAHWLRGGAVSLILQPQTKLAHLCRWLDGNGFCVADASLAADSGRIYPIFLAQTDGRGGERGGDGARLRLLAICAEKRDALLPEYIDALIADTERAARGQARSATPNAAPPPALAELLFLRSVREQLI